MADNIEGHEGPLMRNLAVLSKLSFITNSLNSTEKRLDTIIDLLSITLGVEGCFVLFGEQNKGNLSLWSANKTATLQAIQQTFPEALALATQVLQSGQVAQQTSTLVLPIVSENKILGALVLVKHPSYTFDEIDIQLSTIFSNQLATLLREYMLATALEAEKLRHRAVLELGVDGYIELSPELKITYINAGAEELTGWESKTAIGRVYSEVFKLNHAEDETGIHRSIIEGNPLYNVQSLLVNREKDEKWISFSFKTLKGKDGKILGSIITLKDIHRAKLRDEELRQQIQQLESLQGVIDAISGLSNIEEIYRRALLEVANSISFDVGTFHAVDHLTQTLYLMVGYKPEPDILEYPIANLEIIEEEEQKPSENMKSWSDKNSEGEVGDNFSLHLCHAFKQNEPHIYMAVPGREPCPIMQEHPDMKSCLCVPIKTQDYIYGVMHLASYAPFAFSGSDVNLSIGISKQIAVAAERARLFEEVQQLASTDSMTGLYNKREFWERMEKEMRRSERQRRPLTLMMIDLDRLKWFNDSFGHVQGDLMLVKIGELLQNNCRASDTAFRYGGDELCLLLADTTAEEARVMAERLRAGAREIRLDILNENTVIGAEAMITMSIGIANFPLNALGVEQLFERADAAMFRAKETGKDRVCVFDPEVDTNYRQLKDPEKSYRDTRLELPESLKAEMEARNTNHQIFTEHEPKIIAQPETRSSKMGDFEVAGMEEVDIDD